LLIIQIVQTIQNSLVGSVHSKYIVQFISSK